MPLFESPVEASDGGYAVKNFRKLDSKYGTIKDLDTLQDQMLDRNMYLMLDIVLNHTSDQHAWAQKAKAGDPFYQDFYYTFPNRDIPDAYESSMPEVFPESAPGSFTWNEDMKRWVMTVFHGYQWDLNFTNPEVLLAMLGNIFFYANLGVDVLRIDAPAFIWKQAGTTCQNLPQAHTLLRLIRQCVEVGTPGMALLGEAIVAPQDILPYFGEGLYTGRECHFAYNATQMALQWDMLATTDTRIMLNAQSLLSHKPKGASWITYTRCHDDIGLGYSDEMIRAAGFDPKEHRRFLKDYFTGVYKDSPARGALFGVNLKTQDARISGTLASLCGLEKALETKDTLQIEYAVKRILLMQAHALFLGGLPMLFYGDELGYTNDYSYRNDPQKSYDNRWMHRPLIDWKKNEKISKKGTPEYQIFKGTQSLISIRKGLELLTDESNIEWMDTQNIHVAGFIRWQHGARLFCVFNFSDKEQSINWRAFEKWGTTTNKMWEHFSKITIQREEKSFGMVLQPFEFRFLQESKD
jgi:amylosucrase